VSDNLLKAVKLSEKGSGKIRIFDIGANGRQQREYTSSEMIGNLAEPAELFAEVSRGLVRPDARSPSQEVPQEELDAQQDEKAKIVNLFHYAKDPSRTHGVPCKFVLIDVRNATLTGSRSLTMRAKLSQTQRREYRNALVSRTRSSHDSSSTWSRLTFTSSRLLLRKVSSANSALIGVSGRS